MSELLIHAPTSERSWNSFLHLRYTDRCNFVVVVILRCVCPYIQILGALDRFFTLWCWQNSSLSFRSGSLLQSAESQAGTGLKFLSAVLAILTIGIITSWKETSVPHSSSPHLCLTQHL
jgi:hypothetical protein